VRRSAVAAGLGIAVLPAVLVLVLYLPARLRWRRDVRAIAAALPASAPAFEEYLARRAVAALSWEELRAVTPDPWGAIGGGDHRALADAELARLGLRRPG